MATTDPQKLPITIISRCQRFDFKKISTDDIFNRLKYIANCENIDVSDDALIEIAKMSDGAMRDAIGTLDQVSSYTDKCITIDDIYTLKGAISTEVLLDLCESYVNHDLEKILDIIENIYFEGKNFYLILQDMLMLFRNVLILKKAPKYFENKSVSLKDNIIEISNMLEITSVENIISKLENLSKNIKESNYPRVLFELCLLEGYNECNKQIQKVKYDNEINDEPKEKDLSQKSINSIEKEAKINNKKTNIGIDVSKTNVVVNDFTNETRFEFTPQTSNKKVLINNTIALASNKNKKTVQDSFIELDKYLIEKKYKNAATILKDATITAASEDHLLLTYKYSSMVEENDNELDIIVELISKILCKTYKVVAITEDEWKEQRPYYLNLKKNQGKIDLIEEMVDEKVIQNKNNELDTIDNILNMFGSDLIEMEG